MNTLSQTIKYFLNIYERILNDRLPQEKVGDNHICMDQFKRIMGCYRRPELKVDTYHSSQHSKHIAVMYAGNIYKLPVYDATTNQLVSVQQIYSMIYNILTDQVGTPGNSVNLSVGLLTSLPRVDCYEAMEEMKLSPVNAYSLKVVEESMFGICIDNLNVGNAANALKFCRFGDHTENFKYFNRWFGLGLEIAFTNDGYLAVITEHSMFDGSVLSIFDELFSFQNGKNIEFTVGTVKAELLKWEISPAIQVKIEEAKAMLTDLYKYYDIYYYEFTDFGKDYVKNNGVYFLGFMELAVQLTYYKLYNKLTASYQPVSMRLFHCGRLEQAPTVSSESKAFIESIITKGNDLKYKFKLMNLAIRRFKESMTDASKGEVYVKHLQGLEMLAEREQLNVELFNSNCFKNIFRHHQLATSYVHSNLPIVGAFLTQSKVGHFVSFQPMKETIPFTICTMKTSPDYIPSAQFGCELDASLKEMNQLLIAQNSKLPESKL